MIGKIAASSAYGVTVSLALLAATSSTHGASHLWRFNEVFSNADGTVQFIELRECCGADNEVVLLDKWVRSATTGMQYTFPANLPCSDCTANAHLLLGLAPPYDVVGEAAETRRYAAMVIEWMRSVINQSPEQAEIRGFPRVVSAWDGGEERICRGAPHIIVVHCEKEYGFGAEDSALALSYLELYAPAIGLGSCWGGYFYSAVNAYPKLFEALGLPADHRACGAVMVGYPQLRYQRMPLRKKPRVSYL